jgi:hypothetical protein
MRRGTPNRSMFRRASGNAASEDEQRLLRRAEKPADRHPGRERNRQQHDDREDPQCAIQGEDKCTQVSEYANPTLAHRLRDRRADADRRQLHHDRHEPEHHFGQALARLQHERLRRPLDLRERDREHDGEDRDLERLVARRRLEEALRNGMLEHTGQRRLRRRQRSAGLRRRAGEIHTEPRLHDVDCHEPDDQRQRGHDFEVHERPKRQDPDALDVVPVARHADHQRSEQQRRDQRLDQPEKDGRQHVQIRRAKPRRVSRIRKEPADRDTHHHRDADPLPLRDAAPPRSCRRALCR